MIFPLFNLINLLLTVIFVSQKINKIKTTILDVS